MLILLLMALREWNKLFLLCIMYIICTVMFRFYHALRALVVYSLICCYIWGQVFSLFFKMNVESVFCNVKNIEMGIDVEEYYRAFLKRGVIKLFKQMSLMVRWHDSLHLALLAISQLLSFSNFLRPALPMIYRWLVCQSLDGRTCKCVNLYSIWA
jgi:hypothetical protein